jgi:leucyl aminopeptidase
MEGYKRMKRNILSLVNSSVLFAALTFLNGCGQDTPAHSWIHKNVSSVMQFQNVNRQIAYSDVLDQKPYFIWRGKDVGLSLSSGDLSEVSPKLGQGSLVMVSFSPGSEMGNYLQDAPSTWALHVDKAADAGHALVFVQDSFTLDGLSALAHRENGCGGLQLLSLANIDAGASTLIPPVFSEFVAIEAVAVGKEKVNLSALETTIKTLEAQGTRYHSTDTGLATTGVVETLFKTAAGSLAGFTTEQFSHLEAGASIVTSQKSVIATIRGKKDNETTIVIGAHLDSINSANITQNAPGADDDASGIATLTEVIRVISENGWTFDRRIEFHGYAAEEAGLIGSTHIAQTYREQGRKVAAMLQIDMNAWSDDPDSSTIYIVEPFTSRTLNRSLKDLLHTYHGGDFMQKTLTRGTSDHKSWYQSGFPTAFPFEDPSSYNKAIHSIYDDFVNLNNLKLTARFTKLALTFLAHHAGLTQAGDFSSAKSGFRGEVGSDLFLAISPGAGEGFFNLAVSAPATVEYVEVCRSNAAGDPGCIEEKAISARLDDLSGRRIFSVSTELAIADGNRFAIFGYNSDEKINALRTVRLNSVE